MHILDEFHAIGSIIKYGSMNLQIVESENCDDCKFNFCDYSFCKSKACGTNNRKDKKNIVFKRV